MDFPETVIVTGSRKWTRRAGIYQLLDALQPQRVVHGGANGVDAFAHAWCKKKGRISIVYFPDYSQGDGAPLRRNIKMLEDWPSAVVLGVPLPESRGTWYTMKNAEDRGMKVINGTELLKS